MIIHEKDKRPLFAAIMRDVMDKGENKLISVTGGTQKGKSRWLCAAALALDPGFFSEYKEEGFDITKRIAVIDTLEFIDVINTPAPRGSVKGYDDAGVGINAQDWHDFQVKMLSRIFHIIGNKGWIIIVTTPHYGFLNSQVRAVVTDRVVVKGRDKKNKKIRFKYYSDVNYDERTGKEYKSYPVMIRKNGKKRKARSFVVNEPPAELLKKFYYLEGKGKDEYREETTKDAKREQKIRDQAKKTSDEKVLEAVGLVMNNPEPYIKEHGGRRYIDISLIENDENLREKVGFIGGRISKRIKAAVEKELNLSG